MTTWRILIDHGRSAAEQMACDERLAYEPIPTVRFFTWDPPTLSLGWKQPAPEWLVPPRWAAAGLGLVERPTGGGIACHGSDLSLAVVVPRAWGLPLETVMRAICESAGMLCRTYGAESSALLDAPGARRVTYCVAETSPYAVTVGGRKAAGFALRRYPQAWLVQGSVLVHSLPRALTDAMPPRLVQQLKGRAAPLAEVVATPIAEGEVARRWAEHWPSWWDRLLADAPSPVKAVS